MPQFAPPRNNPATPQISQDIGKAISAAGELAKQAGEVIQQTPDPTNLAKKMLDVASLVVDSNATILEIDKGMKDLEAAGPGMGKAISKLGEFVQAASKLIPDTQVPNGLKPLHKDLKSAASEFGEFSKSYDAYIATTKLSSLNPLNWGASANAASGLQIEWAQFKAAWAKVENHAPAPLRDPALKGAMQDGAKAGLDILKSLLE